MKLEPLQQKCDFLDAQNLSKIVGGAMRPVPTVLSNGLKQTDYWDESTGDSDSDFWPPL